MDKWRLNHVEKKMLKIKGKIVIKFLFLFAFIVFIVALRSPVSVKMFSYFNIRTVEQTFSVPHVLEWLEWNMNFHFSKWFHSKMWMEGILVWTENGSNFEAIIGSSFLILQSSKFHILEFFISRTRRVRITRWIRSGTHN